MRPNSILWKKLVCTAHLANGTFSSVRYSQYNAHILVILVCPAHISVCSFRPLSTFRPIWSGLCPQFGIWSDQYARIDRFALVNTHDLVCLVRPLPTVQFFWTGQYSHSRHRGPSQRRAGPLQILQVSSEYC